MITDSVTEDEHLIDTLSFGYYSPANIGIFATRVNAGRTGISIFIASINNQADSSLSACFAQAGKRILSCFKLL